MGARRQIQLRRRLEERDLLEPAERIAKAHGLGVADMFARSQERHVVASRRAFYQLLVDMDWSAAAIGRLVDRDHTSVTNALRPKRRQRPSPPFASGGC
jgi:chromosomal replication initiation ATPase DnaA